MNIYALITLCACVMIFGIGSFVYLKNKINIVNRLFFIFSISFSIWVLGCFVQSFTLDKSVALLWDKVLYTGAISSLPLYLHFLFTALKMDRKNLILKIIYPISIIFLTFNLLPAFRIYFIKDVERKFTFRFISTPASIWFLFVITFVIFMIYALIKIRHEHKVSQGKKRIQVKYFLLGHFILCIAGPMFFLLPLNIATPPLDTPLLVIYCGLIAYAILRHQLMEIDIAIKKTLVYSSLLSLLTLIYFFFVWLAEFIFRGFIGYRSAPLTVGIFAIFILIFQPLKNKIQFFIDRYFFKGTLATVAAERERLLQEMQRAERLKAVGTLAAGLAHEIKNPLTSIKTFTEYLGTQGEKKDFRDKFQRIVGSEVDKINKIVRDLLDFSKPKKLTIEKAQIPELIDNTLEFLSNQFIQHNIKIAKAYSPNLLAVLADPAQIKQVFLNLFLNAIDAMPNGGELAIAARAEESRVVVSVKDTGKGMAKEQVDHIFDPFYSSKESGTGLGLSIVYGIIQEHRGRITVTSISGKGAEFIIELPIFTNND